MVRHWFHMDNDTTTTKQSKEMKNSFVSNHQRIRKISREML